MNLNFTLNGSAISYEGDPRDTLLTALREGLNLSGTKCGCGEGECGACTVLLNDQPVTSCLVLMGQVNGARISTIEGMSADPIGKHVMKAFLDQGAVQCGFCTPGMVISTRSLLSHNPAPTVEEIKQALGGNLCRCTGYTKIIDGVIAASRMVADEEHKSDVSISPSPLIKTSVFYQPDNLDEALSQLGNEQEWAILSGTTDVGVAHRHQMKSKSWLDMTRISGFNQIREDDQNVYIGGGATFTEITASAVLQRWAKPLVEAALQIGARQIQNRATLAGNLVNASPAADSVPPLYTLSALVRLQSADEQRLVPIGEFFVAPGKTVLKTGELLTEVLIPKEFQGGDEIAFFEKHGPRKSLSISIASVAFRGWLTDGCLKDVRVALGAVGPTVILAEGSAQALMNGRLTDETIKQAGALAAEASQPIDDLRASAAYRRRLVSGLLARGLLEVQRTLEMA